MFCYTKCFINTVLVFKKNDIHDVFACTLLYPELRDYSLGQIAFVFFEGYLLSHCYHTAALSCKRVVNKRL